ncbi:GNAT family N-acetyltransferase [Arthrobacter sp. UM1]|uniref:GNAT family N-acetyltransferase n=1 Tax=Arthrobacter sp. UM1 TaxID=2766776 RepID=UPI001CF714AC|nr:GNAT family N-acetyltransferase [Arthrobacter sp. UM1]MCB4208483.1 GNAT family N-acetyltransferase [Arthrobacter sp. UM1]
MTEYRWLDFTAENPNPPELDGLCHVLTAPSELVWGDLTLPTTPELLQSRLKRPEQPLFLLAAVEADGKVVGAGTLHLNEVENRDLAEIDVATALGREGRGIGSELFNRALERARDLGRTRIEAWTEHRPEGLTRDDDADSAPLPETAWRLKRSDRAVRFALDRGLRPGLMQRVSSVRVRESERFRRFLAETPSEAPAEYELHTFEGGVPDELMEAVCGLFSSFSTEAPSGEMGWEAEVWTPERVRKAEEVALARKETLLSTIAVHRSTGEGAAFTAYGRFATAPHLLQQKITMSAPGHRGHGLGALVKRANAVAALELWPEAEAVQTDNADHNVHMLRINEAMGFETAGATVGWTGRIG